MKNLLVLLITAAIALPAVAQKQVITDPNAEVRQVAGFNAIKISNAFDLYLTQDNKEAVAVSASREEYRNKIKTTVENGVLKIWYDDKDSWWKSQNNRKLKAYVSVVTLTKLSASGACDVYVSGAIKANELEMYLSGASDFKGEINANTLTVDLSGASDAEVKGKVTTLKVESSGASDFKGYELQADNCSAEASGASDIKVTVNKELNARASGASGIHYKGEGLIRDLKSSGASSVSRKG